MLGARRSFFLHRRTLYWGGTQARLVEGVAILALHAERLGLAEPRSPVGQQGRTGLPVRLLT